jgi:hypothetical protein
MAGDDAFRIDRAWIPNLEISEVMAGPVKLAKNKRPNEPS